MKSHGYSQPAQCAASSPSRGTWIEMMDDGLFGWVAKVVPLTGDVD